MSSNSRIGLCVLQYTLAVVILIEAVLFLRPSSAHDFARTHMPDVIRIVLGIGEILGSVLLLMPKTAVRGAWLLFAFFLAAIALHLLHGQINVGYLVIYAAAAFAVAESHG
jgi:uncharacterized membrane protein